MDASEMARKRWLSVPDEERSRLARSAAQARWANATEHDFEMARVRARNARESRSKQLVARALGVSVAQLGAVHVELADSASFRREKTEEQNKYWNSLRDQKLRGTTRVRPRRARQAAVGKIETINTPAFVAGSEKRKPAVAPEIGAHTREVLRELGYAPDAIETLIRSGAATAVK